MSQDFSYREYEMIINTVANNIAKKYKNKKVILGYSAGLDSTMIFYALLKTGLKFDIGHLGHKSGVNRYSCFLDDVTKFMSKRYNIHLVSLPELVLDAPEYTCVKRFKGYDIFITGEGLDACFRSHYNKHGDLLKPGFGERFRSKNIFCAAFELVVRTIPANIRSLPVPIYYGVSDHVTEIINAFNKKSKGIKMIAFAYQPLFLSFISNYKNRFFDWRNMLYRKYYTERYIKEHLGMSWFKFLHRHIK